MFNVVKVEKPCSLGEKYNALSVTLHDLRACSVRGFLYKDVNDIRYYVYVKKVSEVKKYFTPY